MDIQDLQVKSSVKLTRLLYKFFIQFDAAPIGKIDDKHVTLPVHLSGVTSTCTKKFDLQKMELIFI